MNRSDALWELVADHLVELVRLRKQEKLLRRFRDRLRSYGPRETWTGEWLVDRLEEVLDGVEK